MEQVIKELCEDVDTDVRAFLQIPQMYDSDGEPINDVSVSIYQYGTREHWLPMRL